MRDTNENYESLSAETQLGGSLEKPLFFLRSFYYNDSGDKNYKRMRIVLLEIKKRIKSS
jgi:hypothetical protein